MLSQDLYNCLEILREKPSWFNFQKEDITPKLKCFELFKEKGTPQNIGWLFEFLKDKNPELRNEAAETIGVLFGKIKTQAQFYATTKYNEFEKKDLEFFKTAFSTEIYPQLLFIASLNKSGYIREQAVKELFSIQKPEAIKFILFRLGDWVTNVRQAAQDAIRNYFRPEFIDEFLGLLPLIDWLLKVERTNLSGIYARIYEFIFSFEFDEAFYQKLKQFDQKTVLFYIRQFLKSKPVTKEVFELLSSEKLFLIKIELLKHIEKLDAETQKIFIKKFLHDRSAKVRVYAIYSTKPFRAEFYEAIHDAIFDKSKAVRELARFILRESGLDFAVLYRKRLSEDENSLAAILGLAEVGGKDDLPIFEKYINCPVVKIKLACLAVINRLNKATAQKYAMEFFSHSSAKVRNKSIEILSSLVDDEVLETARDRYQKGNYEQKKTILRLFDQIGGWKIVGDFIIALSAPDQRIQNMGWLNLEKWRSKQLFTRPRPEDLARAKRLYEEFDRKKAVPAGRERFWAGLPFYLR